MINLRPAGVSYTTPLQDFESNSISSREEASLPTAAAATSTTQNHHYNNNNICNNVKIDIQLPPFAEAVAAGPIGGNATEVTVAKKRVAHNTVHILGRLLVGLCLLSCIGLALLGFSLWVAPYERGFFCSDQSLKHPFRESTIRSWMLYVMCAVLPVAVILLIEFYRGREYAKNSMHGHYHCQQEGSVYYLCHTELPQWLLECYRKIGAFAFGLGLEQLTTDIAKYAIGRLRPHFFSLCQPVLLDGTSCSDLINAGLYIEEFTCTAVNMSDKRLKDMRLSFPSGHASFACFSMIYMVIYLQLRLHWSHLRMLRKFLQFLLLMFAWYTSLTRISDYKHHWSDVMVGGAIGLTYAVVVVCHSFSCTSYTVDELNEVKISTN